MKIHYIAIALAVLTSLTVNAQTIETTSHGIKVIPEKSANVVELEFYRADIVRVKKYPK
ncbi:MAG: hypothetical protein J6Z18_09585 [Prevotella sp.]|nr:hypothetical protein [Prevotella sp.]